MTVSSLETPVKLPKFHYHQFFIKKVIDRGGEYSYTTLPRPG